MLLVTPTWQSQTLHQLLLKVSIVFPYNQSKIYLSHMLVILMTLTSASRDSQMYCLDVWLMVKSEATSIFALHKLHKNLRKDKAPPKFRFYKYLKDQELCVVYTSNKYRKRRKTWSKNWGKITSKLRKTHEEVHSSTVSRSMKETLKETGVGFDVFKCHTTCSAFTSKESLSEISVDDIINRGSFQMNLLHILKI